MLHSPMSLVQWYEVYGGYSESDVLQMLEEDGWIREEWYSPNIEFVCSNDTLDAWMDDYSGAYMIGVTPGNVPFQPTKERCTYGDVFMLGVKPAGNGLNALRELGYLGLKLLNLIDSIRDETEI